MKAAASRPAADDPQSLTVDLGDRSYDIVVGAGLLARAGELIFERLDPRNAVVVTDETVGRHYLAPLSDALRAAGIDHRHAVLPPGEQTKSFATAEALCERLLAEGLERRSLLLALGGGVIGDITGFVASIALRGIGFVQIPTTLLAQVDSAVGGKTGINATSGKNLIGSFHQPRLVIADTDVLNTLPRRELLAGYAEVVKYGLIGDAAFFDWLEASGPALIDGDAEARRRAIVTSCRMKAEIVRRDERESGARALLNLGHTFGHALEAEAGFSDALLHGEAVAIGMVLAFELSARLGLCAQDDALRVRRHLEAVGLPADMPAAKAPGPPATERLLRHMQKDKKVRDGRPVFVLVRGIGDAFVSGDVDLETVRALLTEAAAA